MRKDSSMGKLFPIFLPLLLIILGSTSCATYRKGEGIRITQGLPSAKKCPDRLDRARIGGMAGSVLGGAATAVSGSSAFGTLINLVGYAVGFTSKDTCSPANSKEFHVGGEGRLKSPPPSVINESNV